MNKTKQQKEPEQSPFAFCDPKNVEEFNRVLKSLSSQKSASQMVKGIRSKATLTTYKNSIANKKDQCITFNFNRNKEGKITEIVITPDPSILKDDHPSSKGKSGDESKKGKQKAEDKIVQDVNQLNETVEKYSKDQSLKIPKSITLQHLNQRLEVYQCIYTMIWNKLLTLPIYSCLRTKLQQLSTGNLCKTAIQQVIKKQYLKLLKDTIEECSNLKGLFDFLMTSELPQRFKSKNTIVFLQIFGEIVFSQKRRANRRKKKRDNEGEDVGAWIGDKEFGDLRQKMARLDLIEYRVPVRVTPEFLMALSRQ